MVKIKISFVTYILLLILSSSHAETNANEVLLLEVVGYVGKSGKIQISKASTIKDLISKSGGYDTYGSNNTIYVITITNLISNKDDSLAYSSNNIKKILYDNTVTLEEMKIISGDILYIPLAKPVGR